jgi:hypothetical protein
MYHIGPFMMISVIRWRRVGSEIHQMGNHSDIRGG